MHRQARQTLVKIFSFIAVIILLILIKGMLKESGQRSEEDRREIRENAVINQVRLYNLLDYHFLDSDFIISNVSFESY